MIVLLDCDDVLSDFTGGILNAFNERKGTKFIKEDMTNWNLSVCLGVPEKDIFDIASEEGFCANLKPLPGVEQALVELNKISVVYCVTSPIYTSKYWMYERTNWLKAHEILPHRVIQGSAKHMIVGDVFVDDRPNSVAAWVHARNRMFNRTDGDGAFLWAQPSNVDRFCHEDHKGAVASWWRTGDWEEIITYVGENKERSMVY